MFERPTSWLIPHWPAPLNVRAMSTTREGLETSRRSPYGFNVGMHCGDDPVAVANNRAFLRDVLALPSEPCWLRQVHGTQVVTFDRSHPDPPPLAGEGARPAGAGSACGTAQPAPEGRAPWTARVRADGGNGMETLQADAAVTRTPGVVLAIQTADCLPVLFAADDGTEIAAAHAGWRGLSSGVLENTLAAMRTPRKNILAWFGPAIAAKSYEIGDEVRDAFLTHDPIATSAFAATRPGHWLCDLYELARQRLRAAGVKQVFGGDCDTCADPRFHSFRRDGARSGRMASLIWLGP